MIRFIKNYFQHSDDRGSIRGLVNFGSWEEFNIIESESGMVRGDHYHKHTDELFIILNGKISVTLQRVKDGGKVKECEKVEVCTGDVFVIDKNINHTFEILEDSKWINVLSVKMSDIAPDIVRIED